MTLFVDSSAFYAAVDAGDRSHARAVSVLGSGEGLITTDHILVETWLLVQRRLSTSVAEGFWSGIRTGAITLEVVGPSDLEVAWNIGRAFSDQSFSIVDRTSFAVMQRVGVLRAASFDDDFAIVRFGVKLDRAIEVVR